MNVHQHTISLPVYAPNFKESGEVFHHSKWPSSLPQEKLELRKRFLDKLEQGK